MDPNKCKKSLIFSLIYITKFPGYTLISIRQKQVLTDDLRK